MLEWGTTRFRNVKQVNEVYAMKKGELYVIGKAKLDSDKFEKFIAEENSHADKREAGWFVSIRDLVPNEVRNVIWENMSKIGELKNCPLYRPSDSRMDKIRTHQHYLEKMQLFWELLYYGNGVAVIRSGQILVGIPEDVVEPMEYENVDAVSIGELRGRIGITQSENGSGTYLTQSTSRNDLQNLMATRQAEIEQKQKELEELEKKKEAELEQLKRALNEKYASLQESLERKRSELSQQMKVLEGQMFLLDTEIYSIRCFMGEAVDFAQLSKGKFSRENEPVVLYQKVRYLDEELGKWAAIYNFDENDLALFEELLQKRSELQDLFAPGPKSVSLVRISKNKVHYEPNPKIANQLKEYETYHASKIGILLRDGDNLWMGWTDEDRIDIPDGNAFYRPKSTVVEAADEEKTKSSSKEETASRYFIYSILRGVLHSRNMIRVPVGAEVAENNPYVIFSLADGWLEDNRYGTFSDIVERTSAPLKKGDMVLTTLRIERDDAHSSGWGRNTSSDRWNNNRGRGEANRTHDASIPNMSVFPINCVDIDKEYAVYYKLYRLPYNEGAVDEDTVGEFVRIEKEIIHTTNDMILNRFSTKGMSPEEVYNLQKRRGVMADRQNYLGLCGAEERYHETLIYDDHVELESVECHYFISAKKGYSYEYDDEKKAARANLEIMEDEYLNLTFLNSVYLLYAIQNRKIGGWKRGYTTMDYASSIPYLNKALEYIREREKSEAEMLGKYMELYDGWQVDLSEWRLKHDYHRLTDLRAKKFAKDRSSGKSV